MALHGEIKINYNEIAKWEAVRAGTMGKDSVYIYRCTVNYTDMRGYSHRRRFFVAHNFFDGAVALAGKVMVEFTQQLRYPEVSDSTAALNFFDAHHMPYPAWALQ